MSEHKPAEVFPPGEYIREELVGRFAYHTGIGMDNAEAILRGERPMTEREIRMTAAYFGTRPEVWEGPQGPVAAPEVLMGGHHERIARYRREQSLALTARQRPDLLAA